MQVIRIVFIFNLLYRDISAICVLNNNYFENFFTDYKEILVTKQHKLSELNLISV